MITILILSKSDDVMVLRYETENPCEAARMFSEDWLNGRIEWRPPAPSRAPAMPAGDSTIRETHRLAFSIKETANLLGVSYATVNRLLQRGLLKSSLALRTKLISRKEIDRFLAETTAD
jgi:excisionase family DNA binding protein